MGDQDLMGEITRQKHQQVTGQGRDIQTRSIGEVHTQLPAIIRLPSWIQVEHCTDATAVIIAETVQVGLIEGAWRIKGEVAFEFFQPQKQLAVERPSHLVHVCQIGIAHRSLPRFQPMNMVAADTFAHRLFFASANSRWRQGAFGVSPAALVGQIMGHITGQKRTLQRPAARGEVIDYGRKRQGKVTPMGQIIAPRGLGGPARKHG